MTKKKILVIEDEVHIQRLIAMVLEKSGMQVITADNGEEGLRKLAEGELPNLILLDIMMPGIDGMQVLRSIRSHSTTKNIPVMMLTALAQENLVLQGVKLGVKGYVRKPFDPNDLVDRITKAAA
jgi:two-component system alkaline phosphatase synthesis response regulator PhoP